MAEKSFDALLRQALLEANWREYHSAWEEAEDPAFSPAYLRWRTRLLADPFGWMKKRLRPLWAKVLRTAACLVLVSALALGSLMAVSPTVRAAVLTWLREITGNLMTYSSVDRETESDALPSNWRITWLPEDWEILYISRDTWKYSGPYGKGSLTYGCYAPGSSGLTTNVDDVSDADSVRETIQVQGTQADYYESRGYRVLLWENEEGFLFLLRGGPFLDRESFLKIAESITYYEGPDVAYEMGWVPPEYDDMHRDELVGAAQEVWTYNQTSLTWRYVTDPICEFLLPYGEAEEVTVGSVTAQYWAAEEPLEPEDSDPFLVNGESVEGDGSSVAVGDVTISVSVGPDPRQTSTLLWSDPDTNTAFLLEGMLDRDDLIRMAESVVQTAPDPSSPPRRSVTMEGTTGG